MRGLKERTPAEEPGSIAGWVRGWGAGGTPPGVPGQCPTRSARLAKLFSACGPLRARRRGRRALVARPARSDRQIDVAAVRKLKIAHNGYRPPSATLDDVSGCRPGTGRQTHGSMNSWEPSWGCRSPRKSIMTCQAATVPRRIGGSRLDCCGSLWTAPKRQLSLAIRWLTVDETEAVCLGERLQRRLRPRADVLDHLGRRQRAEPGAVAVVGAARQPDQEARPRTGRRRRSRRPPARSAPPAPPRSARVDHDHAALLAARDDGELRVVAQRGDRGVEVRRSRRGSAVRARWRTRDRPCRCGSGRGTRRGSGRRRTHPTASARRCAPASCAIFAALRNASLACGGSHR